MKQKFNWVTSITQNVSNFLYFFYHNKISKTRKYNKWVNLKTGEVEQRKYNCWGKPLPNNGHPIEENI